MFKRTPQATIPLYGVFHVNERTGERRLFGTHTNLAKDKAEEIATGILNVRGLVPLKFSSNDPWTVKALPLEA